MRPILIVEDEPAIADLIEMTLEPLGQPLIKAHTGNEAANLLESTLFDLILLDVMLPGVDGFTLMDYIAPTGTPVRVRASCRRSCRLSSCWLRLSSRVDSW